MYHQVCILSSRTARYQLLTSYQLSWFGTKLGTNSLGTELVSTHLALGTNPLGRLIKLGTKSFGTELLGTCTNSLGTRYRTLV